MGDKAELVYASIVGTMLRVAALGTMSVTLSCGVGEGAVEQTRGPTRAARTEPAAEAPNKKAEPVPLGFSAEPYLKRRAQFKTVLSKRGPAPQPYAEESPPTGASAVTYRSGELELKAWVSAPTGDGPAPGLVYFHGGFAFSAEDFEQARPFMDDGFVVMTPMLRAENGNPGDYEFLLGEIDDAAAAARWLARQSYVDADRVYTFGHSAGGAVSAMLSLLGNVPIVHGGSSGGIYPPRFFADLRDYLPFELHRAEEIELRTLWHNTPYMQHDHFAYIGAEDDYGLIALDLGPELKQPGVRLTLSEVEGDHHSSLALAISLYLKCVQDTRHCPRSG